MRIVVLYRPNSEHAGRVLDYIRDYKRIKNKDLETASLETMEGARLAELYGVTQYPALLAVGGDGSLHKLWQGETLPLMNELDYYTQDTAGFYGNRVKDLAVARLLSA